MRQKLVLHVEHFFHPDPASVRRGIEALVRWSDEAQAKADMKSEVEAELKAKGESPGEAS